MTLKFQVLEFPQLPNEYGMQFTGKAFSDVALLLMIWTFSILNCFVLIFFSYRCDSIDKLKAKLPNLESEISDPAKYRQFYHFTFNYAKNAGQKGLGK